MPAFPIELSYLWSLYYRLRRRIGSNGFGANPISWPDIDAFLRQSGRRLSAWEIEIIEAIDDAYLAATAASERDVEGAT